MHQCKLSHCHPVQGSRHGHQMSAVHSGVQSVPDKQSYMGAGVIKNARLVSGCMHRFCAECIEKWLRVCRQVFCLDNILLLLHYCLPHNPPSSASQAFYSSSQALLAHTHRCHCSNSMCTMSIVAHVNLHQHTHPHRGLPFRVHQKLTLYSCCTYAGCSDVHPLGHISSAQVKRLACMQGKQLPPVQNAHAEQERLQEGTAFNLSHHSC